MRNREKELMTTELVSFSDMNATQAFETLIEQWDPDIPVMAKQDAAAILGVDELQFGRWRVEAGINDFRPSNRLRSIRRTDVVAFVHGTEINHD